MKGIWAAALMPYAPDLSIDEKGFRKNLRHWVDDLGIDGVFIAGKQSEFFSMSVAERKRSMEIVVDEIGKTSGVIASCSDQNMDVVIDLAKHAQAIGAPYIVVHAPVLHFLGKQDETLYQYYKTISESGRHRHRDVEPPGLGYLMSPELCARIASCQHRRRSRQRAARDVRAADAACRRQADRQHGLGGGVVRQHRRARLAALSVLVAALPVPDQGGPPDARVHRPCLQGRGGEAKAIRDSLIRCARRSAARGRPRSQPSHSKYWQELLGQVGGRCAADAGTDRRREGSDAPRVRDLRAEASGRGDEVIRGVRERTMADRDDCRRSTSRSGSTRTSICSSRRSATRRCSRTAT
jgi:4-hydroxy-tetrahydrodipicolinate synthase